MLHVGANHLALLRFRAIGMAHGAQSGLEFTLLAMLALGAMVWAVCWQTQR